MQMMNEEEVKEFLSQPLIGRLATVKKNCSPHIAPVWFIYDEGNVLISTGKDSLKARNLRNNPRAALDVDVSEGEFNHKGVIFEGGAELVEKDALETTKKIYLKYLGTLEHPMAKQLLALQRVTIKLKPSKTISWDYSKMGGGR